MVRRRTLLLAMPLAGMLPAAAATPPRVVATFSILGDMTRRIAGDRVVLTTIVGPDGDSEAYEPTAADARASAQADLLVMNGLNPEFEPWLGSLLQQAQFHGIRLVASDGARVLKKAEEPGAPADAKPDELDQHAWHDVANGALYAANIAAALMRLDPAHADEYHTQAEAYRRELLDLDAWAKQRVADVPAAKRKVITSHDAFAYLARAYGITMIGARGWTNDREASAADVARLIQQIRQDKVRAIFVENMNDPRLIQRIAREAGATVGGELYSDALSRPGGDGETYVKMVRHNIETLRSGMMKN
jgi:zinc/manganese transport system substrate-binding protein